MHVWWYEFSKYFIILIVYIVENGSLILLLIVLYLGKKFMKFYRLDQLIPAISSYILTELHMRSLYFHFRRRLSIVHNVKERLQ